METVVESREEVLNTLYEHHSFSLDVEIERVDACMKRQSNLTHDTKLSGTNEDRGY